MQYSLSKVHRRHKWQQLKSWISSPDCQVAMDKQQTQYRLTLRSKWKMHYHCQKIQNRSVQTFGYVYQNTNHPTYIQYGRSSHSSWAKFIWSSFSRTTMGTAIRESSMRTRFGKKFKIGNACSLTEKKGSFLSVLCGRYKTCWEETEHQSDVENTYERRWCGRTDIILWPRLFGLHPTRMSNKQRKWTHNFFVWIRNLCWSNRKATSFWESWRKHFLMVLRHGRSCKEMRGTILRTVEQINSTTLQSRNCMLWLKQE